MIRTAPFLVCLSLLVGLEAPPAVSVITNSIGMKLAYVSDGTFEMGSAFDDPKHQYDEYPHQVRITKSLRIAVTEVTQSQWKAVMGEVRSGFQGEDLPVDSVSWRDAVTFCERLSQKEGRTYRLPSEAEWEHACRAGDSGDSPDQARLGDFAWYDRNSDETPHKVGTKTPNAWGLFDMRGNVSEWCSDRYDADYSREESAHSKVPLRDLRVVRGGSYASFPDSCRCAARNSSPPSYQLKETGFRVVLEEAN
jgi:formylglycine-generating enzyme required for sulfatase activity